MDISKQYKGGTIWVDRGQIFEEVRLGGDVSASTHTPKSAREHYHCVGKGSNTRYQDLKANSLPHGGIPYRRRTEWMKINFSQSDLNIPKFGKKA